MIHSGNQGPNMEDGSVLHSLVVTLHSHRLSSRATRLHTVVELDRKQKGSLMKQKRGAGDE